MTVCEITWSAVVEVRGSVWDYHTTNKQPPIAQLDGYLNEAQISIRAISCKKSRLRWRSQDVEEDRSFPECYLVKG
jgi:hypothetical protein